MTAKVGDFVTARVVEGDGAGSCRQGVLIGTDMAGRGIVQGMLGRYLCEPPEAMRVVPDGNLFGEARQFVQRLRREMEGNTDA